MSFKDLRPGSIFLYSYLISSRNEEACRFVTEMAVSVAMKLDRPILVKEEGKESSLVNAVDIIDRKLTIIDETQPVSLVDIKINRPNVNAFVELVNPVFIKQDNNEKTLVDIVDLSSGKPFKSY